MQRPRSGAPGAAGSAGLAAEPFLGGPILVPLPVGAEVEEGSLGRRQIRVDPGLANRAPGPAGYRGRARCRVGPCHPRRRPRARGGAGSVGPRRRRPASPAAGARLAPATRGRARSWCRHWSRRRASTSSSRTCSWSASVASERRETRLRTGSPSGRRRDQPQQEVAEQRPLLLRDLVVDLLGRLGDRPPDAPGALVPLDGERAALAPVPTSRGARATATAARRARPRPPAPAGPPAPAPAAGRPGGLGRRWRLADPRRSWCSAGAARARPGGRTPGEPDSSPRRSARSGDDEWSALGVGGQRGEEGGALRRVLAQGHGLLDTGPPPTPARGPNVGIAVSASIGRAPGVDHHDTAASSNQRGRHARSHQRRLPASRRPDDGEDADGAQPPEAGVDLCRPGRRTHRCPRRRTGTRPR